MIDLRKMIKGGWLLPQEFAAVTDLIQIPDMDKYFWWPDGDCVLSRKSGYGVYRMKRNEGFCHFGTESYYTLTRGTGNGNRIYTMSELRAMTQPPEIKKEENMKQEQYIVGSITKLGNVWSITHHPVIHHDMTAAKIEAARLAKLNPEKKFVVLKVEGIVAVADVVWE